MTPEATGAAARAAIARLCPEGRIGVALSGGGDSTALLRLAAAALPAGRIAAATVDHRLRPAAASEAAAAARAARRLGLPHRLLRAPAPPAPGGNLQARLRALRMCLLGEWAAEAGLAAVLLGHTLDDQAETVLLRLARGSGVDGLSAMAEARRAGGTLWLRPLLGLSRAALRDWLRAEGAGWTEDPSNADPRYDRVRARRALETLAPLGIDPAGLAATAGRLAGQRRVLEAAADRLAQEALRWTPLGEALIAADPFEEAERDTALRLLARALGTIAPADYAPRHAALAAFARHLSSDGRARTLAGVLGWAETGPDGRRLRLAREPAAAAAAPAVAARDGAVWDGRWRIGLRAERAGLRVSALGTGRLPAGERAPAPGWPAASAAARRAAPALFGPGGGVLAVPHAGWRAEGAPAAIFAMLAPEPPA